jgi:hypothetical protein
MIFWLLASALAIAYIVSRLISFNAVIKRIDVPGRSAIVASGSAYAAGTVDDR